MFPVENAKLLLTNYLQNVPRQNVSKYCMKKWKCTPTFFFRIFSANSLTTFEEPLETLLRVFNTKFWLLARKLIWIHLNVSKILEIFIVKTIHPDYETRILGNFFVLMHWPTSCKETANSPHHQQHHGAILVLCRTMQDNLLA